MIVQDPKPLINFLNSLVKIDKAAVFNLINARVKANQELLDHPSVQCTVASDGNPKVGFLGVLNGYCGTLPDGPKKGWGPIAAVYEDDDCEKLIRFEHTENPKITSAGTIVQTNAEIINKLHQGDVLPTNLPKDQWPELRKTLHVHAGKYADAKDGVRMAIFLEAVKLGDKTYGRI